MRAHRMILYAVNTTYLVVQRQWALEGDIFSADTGDHAQALGPDPSGWGLCIQLELLNSLKADKLAWVSTCRQAGNALSETQEYARGSA